MNLSVIGLGKLGLPLACLQAQHHRVFGIDQNESAVACINKKVSPIIEPGIEPLLEEVIDSGQLTAHTDYAAVQGTDMSLIIVPTPSKDELLGAFTSEYVLDAVQKIGQAIRHQSNRHVVVVCSTVMPGECDGPIRETFERHSGKTVGEDVGLVYSPEFIALGTVIEDMKWPAVTLIGESDHESGEAYLHVARSITNEGPTLPPNRRMSLTSAEIAKIALNAYVTMKISFANALGEVCERYVNADALDISQAIGCDPRVGPQYIRPGGPYGGPCFPRDNRAFALVGRNVGVTLPLAEASDEINNRQVERLRKSILEYGRPKVGIIGMSYKLGTPIIEEAFGVNLALQFPEREVTVYNRQELLHKESILGPPVVWTHDVSQCFGDDAVTVLALPDLSVNDRLAGIFGTEGKRHSILIDCWNVIPEGPWDDTHIERTGRWNI